MQLMSVCKSNHFFQCLYKMIRPGSHIPLGGSGGHQYHKAQ
jgi:hypothetical protein